MASDLSSAGAMNEEERQRLIWLERKVTELLWLTIIGCRWNVIQINCGRDELLQPS
jgi:hypothetical protein